MTVDGGIDSYGKDVLVVLGEGSWRHNVSIRANLARVDIDDRDNAGGSGLDGDTAERGQCIVITAMLWCSHPPAWSKI